MILPHTHAEILFLLVLSTLCWASWANGFKLAGKWRFELFYVDFVLGLIVLTLIYAFTVGNLGFDGFNLVDDIMHAGKHQWLYAFAAGVIFNFANMLLMGSVSVAGMALAFPVAFGTALAAGSCFNQLTKGGGAPVYVFAGCALVAAAVAADAMAHRILTFLRHEELAKAGMAKSTRRPAGVKGIVLALVAGALMSISSPLLQKATATEIGLGPYGLCVLFALGVAGSTVIFDMFLMNLPLEGEPLGITDYLRGSVAQHLLGFVAGALWCTGAVAAFAALAANAEPGATGGLATGGTPVGPAARFALSQAAAPLAALWGIFAWKDLKGGDGRVKLLVAMMLVLLCGGIALLSLAAKA